MQQINQLFKVFKMKLLQPFSSLMVVTNEECLAITVISLQLQINSNAKKKEIAVLVCASSKC